MLLAKIRLAYHRWRVKRDPRNLYLTPKGEVAEYECRSASDD